MDKNLSRRQYLATLGMASVAGVAGCSQINSEQTATPSRNLGGANFTFEYNSQAQQVTIQYNGGATIQAGNLQVRSSSGMQTEWSQLGSTTTGADAQLSTGATAVLGVDTLNWGQAVGPSEMIRLVYAAGNGPSTLGRFTPTESATLTSTVPSTPTPEPTATPPADTTAPSITAFSLSNPSGQELRTSFESDEDLASIEVSISGAETVILTATDFSESVSGGTYTYEATYQASSDGDYTATLDEATDGRGNDGASSQSVSISVDTTENWDYQEDFEEFSVGTNLSSISGWEITLNDSDAGTTFEIEEQYGDYGGAKALGATADGLYAAGAEITTIENFSYPDTGFRIKAILSTEDEDHQPNIGVIGEDTSAGLEIDNHPYNGREIRFGYFDDTRRMSREFEYATYEIEVVGQADQTLIASLRNIESDSWETFSESTEYSGEISGIYINTNNGGQFDDIRLRQEADPQPSGEM